MNLQHPLQMIYSSRHGWDQLGQRHPSVLNSFVKIVLPASLFAGGMVLYTATYHADSYAPGVPLQNWQQASLILLLTSWLAVSLMAWVIRQSVHASSRPAFADCYRLAALVPLPIWLSAVSLLLPYPALNVLCALLGLAASAGLLYHGLDAWFEHDDSVHTLSLAYTIFAIGALVWLFVVALLLLPLL
ncbi:hypothetical protein VI06_07915 [Aquitalea magnusonii]|uniref:YIP1 family protein n=1 Tax=Aquitalea TaxID=407217 RepID=UPI0005F7F050|nr:MULTISPECIES: YIP1 family protein [Aquitalea]KJV30659.1 hypothetical protein VI06_07915 [Aquitalea magnusonii]